MSLKAAAYRLLEEKLPASWVLKRMTEREDTWDCLLEVLDDEGLVSGYTAWIQLKARRTIAWDETNRYRLGRIKKTTIDYTTFNSGPVFIFLVDLARSEIFFLDMEYFISKQFTTYLGQGSYPWLFDRADSRLDNRKGWQLFRMHLEKQAIRKQFENELTIFLSNRLRYNQACRSGEPDSRLITMMRRNGDFLCNYFRLEKLPESFWEQLQYPQRTRYLSESGLIRMYRSKEVTLLYCIRSALAEPLAYWALSHPAMYYYAYSLARISSII